MGFLKQNIAVEQWLQASALEVEALSAREYMVLTSEWRSRFETALGLGNYVEGKAARRAIGDALPFDAFVFSMPGYRLLPAATNPRFDQTYAYRVRSLSAVAFASANRSDAIVTDVAFTLTCLCTHEAGIMAHERFCEP